MFLARVTGSVVASQKVVEMTGQKLLLVDPLRVDQETKSTLKPIGRTFVAIDLVGVGEGDVVMIVQGSSARMTDESSKLPIDAAVIGLVHQVTAHGNDIKIQE